MAGTITVRKVFDEINQFAITVRDISRPGINGHRFKKIGKRGRRQTIRAVQLYPNKQTAQNDIDAINALVSNSIDLIDTLEGQTYKIVLVAMDATPPKVVTSTDGNTHAVNYRFDIIRTG